MCYFPSPQAHKAKGKFSYCEVIKAIHSEHRKFRVVALSATPGKTNDVIEIVQNLLISKIEIRSESSPDVAKYTFKKEIVRERVKLDYLEPIKDNFMQILEPYLRKLVEAKAISTNNIGKGWIIIQQKKFATEAHPNRSEVMSLFSIVISFLHSLELLERHGIFMFLESFRDDDNVTRRKYFVNQDRQLKQFLDALDVKYQSRNPLNLNINPLPNGTIPAVDADIDYGHPKFDVLRTKLVEFFDSGGSKTIIFCEYRDTVKLIFTMLLQLRPKVQPRMLIGQGGTVSQKDQLNVMRDFRSNKVNVLITTSVCEEGIDVGEVDLVICFDTNTKNTTRFVQRIGRTGRKRNGRVLMLVTEGKEDEALMSVIETKKKLNKSIASSSLVRDALYRHSPRLIPSSCLPRCIETRINIPEKKDESNQVDVKKTTKKSKKSKSAATASIASHFHKITTALKVEESEAEIETLAQIQDDATETIDENFNSIKLDFNVKFDQILSKLSKHDEMLISNLKWKRDRDIATLERIKRMFDEPLKTEDDADDFELNFDFLNTSLPGEGITNFSLLDSSFKPSSDFSENPLIVSESRYMSQQQFHEPLDAYAQFKQSNVSSPAAGNVKLRTSTPSHPSTSTPLVSRSRRKNSTAIGDSPLLKAFQKQREMSKNLFSPPPVPTTSSSRYTVINSSNCSSFPRKIDTRDFGGSVIGSSINSNAKNDVSVTTYNEASSSSVRQRTQRQRKEKTMLEFFNIKSIDDIFEGIDFDDGDADPDTTPDIIPSSEPFEQIANVGEEKELFEDVDDDNYLMQIPEIAENHSNLCGDVDSTPNLGNSECSTPTSSSHARRTRKRKEPNFELDFNIDEIFDGAGSDDSSQKENSPKIPSCSKKAAEGSGIETDEITSPNCSPPKRTKPNFAKLINALRTPNFLSMPAGGGAVKSDDSTVVNSSPLAHCSKALETTHSRAVVDFSIVKSDDDLSTFVSPVGVRKKPTRKRPRRDFLDTQAGVDGSDSEDDEDEIDESLMDFVVDESHVEHDERVDMQAKYLESLRSPSARQNGIFKMPRRPAMFNKMDVFSQDPNLDVEDEDDDDEMDSFIVSNSQQVDEHNETLDELEIAERILKEKRKNAKLARRGIKRRKIIRNDSSDEEEELQQLRKQLENDPD